MAMSPYLTLIELGSRLSDVEFLDEVEERSIASAVKLLEDINPVLQAAQLVDLSSCEVPVEFRSEYFSRHVERIGHLRSLARAFYFAAEVSAFHADLETVAKYGKFLLGLANAARRGGLVVDHLTSDIFSEFAIESLRKVRDQFIDTTRRDLISALERYEFEREPYTKIAVRDRHWEMETESAGNHDGELLDEGSIDIDAESELMPDERLTLMQMINDFSNLPKADIEALHAIGDGRVVALSRLLSIELAVRSWEYRCERYPNSLDELASDSLFSIPLDPFTGNEFIYQTRDDGLFSVYSTGPDQTDSGGNFGSWIEVLTGGHDLCLDAADY